ncbi:hypothetical protein E1171_19705 [Cytophagales bacterium RKSG123]|nr:hypothetical protein [Xanthovirga aplysinae]
MEGSDRKAIKVVDKMMKAMGGRKNYDNTHYLEWNFFGMRKLIWDKWKGDVRIEFFDSDLKILVNINDGKGKAFKDGKEVTDQASLAAFLKKGISIWINDSYWLVMPFKLKDPGVTLKYIGKEEDPFGNNADVVDVTFKNVGDTPKNRYRMYIDNDSHLMTYRKYYEDASQEEATIATPWTNYKQYGSILLASNRGERDITDIHVFKDLPESVFTSFEEVDLSQYK